MATVATEADFTPAECIPGSDCALQLMNNTEKAELVQAWNDARDVLAETLGKEIDDQDKLTIDRVNEGCRDSALCIGFLLDLMIKQMTKLQGDEIRRLQSEPPTTVALETPQKYQAALQELDDDALIQFQQRTGGQE